MALDETTPRPANTNTKTNSKVATRQIYAPMSSAAWDARVTYLRQALAKLRDPSLPEPDPALLTVGPHGPFTALWVAPAPNGEPISVYFTVQNAERGPRWCPPEVFLMLDGLLAPGGGVSVNDNGGGWAYVRPWSGNHRHTLGRLVTDARPGQVIKQSKRADHHEQHPQHFRVTGVSKQVNAAKGSPRRGREDAIAHALYYWDRSRRRSDIRATRAEYEAFLRDAFRLVDVYYGQNPEAAEVA